MKAAVILVNLGTPVAPTKKAVKAFLREFLSDHRVVEVPRPIWMLVLNLIVIPLRAGRVANAYRSIWHEGGSPLRLITEKQVDLLQEKLREQSGDNAPLVRHAMTYSGPELNAVIEELEEEGIEHYLVLPLYPQYSATTTGSVYDRVANIVSRRRNVPEIQVIKQYYDNPLYIDALAQSVREIWDISERPEQLLMSFHSIPEEYCDLGDPYFQQCKMTAELLAAALGLEQGQWAISFQSRVGYSKWLSPYTIDTLRQWGSEKLASVDVICPAFSTDCLETLEEIDEENRHVFQNAGGGRFRLIPCLNDHPAHIDLMANLVNRYLPQDD